MTFYALLFLACGGDVEWDRRGASVERWEHGERLSEQGDVGAAREAFAQARALYPNDPYLLAWEASSAAAQEDWPSAFDLINQALDVDPGFAEARYNRASYHARRGHLREAATDLKRALDDGACEPREVLLDSDFKPYLNTPEFRFLPQEVFTVVVEAPEKLAFWGSDVRVRLRVIGAADEPIEVTGPSQELPLQLVETIEDQAPSTQGIVQDLTWVFRVVGAGDVSLGPWHLSAGHLSRSIASIPIRVAAPSDKESGERHLGSADIATPRQVVGDRTAPDAWRTSSGVVVLVRPDEQVELTDHEPAMTYRKKVEGRTRWVAYRFPYAPTPARVAVRRDGERVFAVEVP